jgi:hypothetical protein
LIELLFALMVLSIGMFGMLRATSSMIGMSGATVSMMAVHTANERSAHAAALLQDRMETLKHSGYSGAATVSSTEDYGTIAQYSTYKRVTTVAVNTPAANMKTVTVSVYWQNDRHTLSASTILAE